MKPLLRTQPSCLSREQVAARSAVIAYPFPSIETLPTAAMPEHTASVPSARQAECKWHHIPPGLPTSPPTPPCCSLLIDTPFVTVLLHHSSGELNTLWAWCPSCSHAERQRRFAYCTQSKTQFSPVSAHIEADDLVVDMQLLGQSHGPCFPARRCLTDKSALQLTVYVRPVSRRTMQVTHRPANRLGKAFKHIRRRNPFSFLNT